MKKLFLALMALAIVSCDSNKSNDGGGNATVPGLYGGCMNGAVNCNSAQYNNYPGFVPYGVNPYNYGGYNNYYNSNYSYFNSPYTGMCNCPSGYVPTYNGYYGLGCVQNSYLPSTSWGIYASWGWGATNGQWTNIPQVSNTVGMSSSGACYNGVLQSCFVDVANSCSSGYRCQATTSNSRMGLCVSGYGSGGYSPR